MTNHVTLAISGFCGVGRKVLPCLRQIVSLSNQNRSNPGALRLQTKSKTELQLAVLSSPGFAMPGMRALTGLNMFPSV